MKRIAGGERGQVLAAAISVASVAMVAALAAASLRPAASRSEVAAAALSLAAEIREMSLAATVDGTARALVFPAGGESEPLRLVRDAAADGISRASIEEGLEEASVPFRLGRDHPGVRIALPEGPSIAAIPPSRSRLDSTDPSLRFGSARMLVLTPEGHATSGSLYLSGRAGDVCAIVVYGATVRVRVWCHNRASDLWRLE